MRIRKETAQRQALYRVYPAEVPIPDQPSQLMKELRRADLPFVVGAHASDPNLILRIGPLSLKQAEDFDAKWASFIEPQI